jgi:hypothetical protein
MEEEGESEGEVGGWEGGWEGEREGERGCYHAIKPVCITSATQHQVSNSWMAL